MLNGGCCAIVLPLYVWGGGHGGNRGRLLPVSVFMATDFCGEVRPRSLRGEWTLHHITLGTYGSRPSEAREWEAWDRLGYPPFPSKVVVVVVGLQELHLLWYGLEHGSDPPSPLLYHPLAVGLENGHSFSISENLWFSAVGSPG